MGGFVEAAERWTDVINQTSISEIFFFFKSFFFFKFHFISLFFLFFDNSEKKNVINWLDVWIEFVERFVLDCFAARVKNEPSSIILSAK